MSRIYSVPLPVPSRTPIVPTVTPILRAQKRDRRGKCPIWLRISDRDGDRYLSLGVKILPSQWNKLKGRVRSGHPNSDRINLLLQRKEAEAEEEILRLQLDDKVASADRLKGSLTSTSTGDFIAFANDHLEDLLSREKVGRYRRLKATLKKLEDFSGSPLPFDKITPAFLNAFETHCLQLGNKQSTVAANLSDVRALFSRAERFGATGDSPSPFRRFKIKQGDRPERTKLSFDEIRRLEALDLSREPFDALVRDFFLMCFYSGGLRFSDAVTMRRGRIISSSDGEPDRVVYRAGKTGKQASVKITPPASRILDKYLETDGDVEAFVFPFLERYDLSSPRKFYNAKSSVNTRVNKCLKRLGLQAGITEPDGSPKPISTHIARHSFADVARTSGWSIYDISKALQHSSLEVTERYLKAFDETSLDKAMQELFGGEE